MKGLYSISIQCYYAALKLASLFHPKAKLWVNGRKRESYPALFLKKNKCIWFHCASLGEFEQARPLIEFYKNEKQATIVLTFFSPSGYEVRKNYPYADWIGYLPYDNPKNANQFLDLFKPDLVFMVKYEFWFHFLQAIQERQIPLYLISGLFRSTQLFFKPWGSWFLHILKGFKFLFLQDQKSQEILAQHQIFQAAYCGDTRLDRVIQIKNQLTPNMPLEQFSNGQKCIILGSVWPQDLEIIEILIRSLPQQKFIIAPHNLDNSFMNDIAQIMPNRTQFYTQFQPNSESQILILNTMGMLASAYAHAHIAYVGGGFGKAVHNTMEPAVFGIPIFFGPSYHKFHEAIQLIECGAAKSFQKQRLLAESMIALLSNSNEAISMGQAAAKYVVDNSGASQFIINHINE